MSDATNVKVWPCVPEAIDWSHDGIIALAADDSVELLFPNSDINESEHKNTSWQRIPLQAPWFTSHELPEKEPAPVPLYSVGEEISTSSPINIAWSPPGLAKHRRCALGVLTSSLVLSIWSADGSPRSPLSWRRRLIINDSLRDYFKNDVAVEGSVLLAQDRGEEIVGEYVRLRSRARAFTWAPALPSTEYSCIVGTQWNWGQHIVAVANEDNQIALVIVESPASTFGKEDTWNAEVLNHFTIMPDSESIFTVPNTFDDFMKQQRYVSHIAWSPWTIQGDWFHSVLVYATSDDVRARIVTYRQDTIGLGDEVVYQNVCLRHKGPMKWSPRIIDDDKLTLALFGNDGLSLLTVSMSDAAILDCKTHSLDGRWDEISGVVWNDADNTPARLHISSIHSTLSCPTAAVEMSGNKIIGLSSPNWREQISDTQALFSAQNDLKGNVKSKVWGLCGSPLGDFISACHTIHPSDMLEYGPPKERYCAVAISNSKSYNKNQLVRFPANGVSAESIAFTLRKWLENTVEDAGQVSVFAEEMLNNMMSAHGPIQKKQTNSDRYHDSNDIAKIATSFKLDVFMDVNMFKDRYTILINQICSMKPSNTLPKVLIAFRLATATVNTIPKTLTHGSSFSRDIFASHQQLLALVNKVINQDIPSGVTTTTTTASGTIQSHPESDTCDFCEAVIPFSDLETATCLNGHQFPRCGLTFLAIQAPRISKFCGICGTGFFNEEFVAVQEALPGNSGHELEDVEGQVRTLAGSNPDKLRSRGDNGTHDTERNEMLQRESEDRQTHQDDLILAQATEQEEDVTDELPVSLARILFLACDVCIYCGGKYIG
ncbi:hypothetical protein DM02DRAFT_529925 [Periconia macrospinosa]|uniref:Transcription factor IIIC putative zinc-finger domain-containing protein n=1 Tax=Periconia macrospinosa TaxID=97972 RepID=A0A2V1DPI4_9PLEO|nr:hypothetical protein DM02DRAFT_529925 [Periconia macrospinosa]